MSQDDYPRCPCGTDLPAAEVCALRSPRIVRRPWWVFWREPVEVLSVVTGYRYACQAKGCGMLYSVGPRGMFVHDRGALPYMAGGDVPRGTYPPRAEEIEDEPTTEPDNGPPLARERSRV